MDEKAQKSLFHITEADYLAFAGIWLATATLLLPGTMSPLVVNVTPVNTEVVGTPSAKLPGATVTFAPDAGGAGAAGGTAAFGSAPSALATATGSEVRPGLISAAGVTNFRAVATSVALPGAGGGGGPPVGAAITDVDTAFASLFTREPGGGGAAAHGAVTVI